MLNPNEDRLDYSELLSPPENYELDFAVGTTYSLDLDALVGASIALGFSEETDSSLLNNPVFVLEALRSTGDKIAIFCEGGQIHYPTRITPLYALLEQVVFQVSVLKKNSDKFYPSFHPKTWIIRYISEHNDVKYRFIVLSRNLTFDHSWDVSFAMDGDLTTEVSDENIPLIDFIHYLQKSLDQSIPAKEKSKKISMIMKELIHVKFDTGMKKEGFDNFEFVPTGIPDSSGRRRTITDFPLFQSYDTSDDIKGFNETLIISPFLSRSVIQYFSQRNESISDSRMVLITRAMSLRKLKPEDCENFDIYVVKDDVVEGETIISEEGAIPQKQDIHAKVYMTRDGSDTYLYLGSLNASRNAIEKNVEFMICLKSKSRYLNLDKLETSLFGSDDSKNPFQKVDILDYQNGSNEEEQNNLDLVVKEIVRQNPLATVVSNNEYFDINLHINQVNTKYDVTVNPLLSKKTESLSTEIIFSKLLITQLSEFYCVSVSDDKNTIQRIIKIQTLGIPENRDKEIVTGIVNDKSNFYRYIAFLLGDDNILSSMEDENITKFGFSSKSGFLQELPTLYEKMLRASTSSDAKKKFDEIDYLISSISKDGVVPEHFTELYETFKKVVNKK